MESLLQLGLSNALMATVLALPAAWVGHYGKRPALAHGLWLLVVLKLLTPPLLPIPVLWLSPPEPGSATPGRSLDFTITGSRTAGPPFAESPATQGPSTPAPSLAPALFVRSPDPVGAAAARLSWTGVIGLVWAAGSVLWFATLGWRAHRFQRLLRGARRGPPDLQERARGLALRLGLARCPGVWLIPGRVSPMLWALAGPPRLLLPSGLWSQLSDAQRDTLLAHELAHVRRRDHWVRWLELAAVGLYWWHPLAWWAERQLQEAGEQCCDAWVVAVLPAAADAYAEALLETVAYLSQARAAVPVGASGAGRVHLLKRRLIMILNGTAPKALSPVGRWAVLALGVVLLPLWPTWAHSQVPGDRAISGADRAVVATNAADDEASEEQLHQERATVRELTAELERMRARVETLARRLQEAQARLARLEGRNEPPRVNGVHQGPIHLDNTALPRVNPVVRPHTIGTLPTVKDGQAANVAPMLAALGARADTVGEHQRANPAADLNRSDRHRGGDYDQRLREVEAKIDRLLEELKRLREQQPPRPSEPRRF